MRLLCPSQIHGLFASGQSRCEVQIRRPLLADRAGVGARSAHWFAGAVIFRQTLRRDSRPGVYDTHQGVYNTCLGVSNPCPGVSAERRGVFAPDAGSRELRYLWGRCAADRTRFAIRGPFSFFSNPP